MKILDEWINPKSLAEDFEIAMRGPQDRKGNPPETIDYSNLKVGEEVTMVKTSNKW